MCHCALIDNGLKKKKKKLHCILSSGDPLWLTGCYNSRTVKGQRTFKLWTLNMTDLWLQPVLWTLQTLKNADGEWPTEQYTPWTLQTLNWHWTLYTLNPSDNWILDWTLPILNNSRQTMNAVDCNPANTIDYVCYRFCPIDWTRLRNWTDAIDSEHHLHWTL